MKKLLYITSLIIIWLLNVDAGNKTEWWVELINDNGTITKVKRSEYLEYKEMLNEDYTPEGKQKIPYIGQYMNWEYREKYVKQQ